MRGLEGLNALWETLRSILPLTAILAFFQIVILRKPIENLKEFGVGFLLSVFGLHFFLKGVSMSLFPLGDSVGNNLVVLERKWVIVVVAFIIGYFGTLVEPALKALALEVEEISIGAIPHRVLIHAVAIGFGTGMGIGIFKILNGVSYIKIIVPLLVLIIGLSFFAPEEFVSIAMDSASATTGPVNIPLNMALAIGLAKVVESADPLLSGFGIVGLTSIGAMISVLTLGILTKI
ncbi:conserved membrane hypothetical protein [[Clostridium] ultunense Esp]|uniref:DUF1538 domain-containing protein n=1 Tax=[Clostridium] ultunense Esp TaxID=1288971 RepID=M1ZFG3_9FIRM|nr:DUF1538 domain-containing protein [Schnuerera ultunensis]CCQ97079.1 conserved membrane hypothetical protein [[Clostridium] ultunense Esp]SHD78310.1 conserved membrane protein of unknown function [[Clostridium] ultunense Esp]